MARVYRDRRDFSMPDEITLWRAEALARGALDETIRDPNGKRTVSVRVEADGGYEVLGDDFAAVMAELRGAALEPTYSSTQFFGWHFTSFSPSVVRADIQRCYVTVEIVGDDEGAVRSLIAKVQRLVEPLAVRPDGLDATSSEPSVATTGWFRRTWRDHAMTLALTVAGTVLATLIIVWLRLN